MKEGESMSNDVVISKELRDRIVSGMVHGFGPGELSELKSQILAAPQPVAPVQSGGVVSPEMMEALAADEHDRWSGQARTALDEMTSERRERWDRLSRTPYSELTEEMKELDRMQVRERLAIMGAQYQPVAPVQSGGVDIEALLDAIEAGDDAYKSSKIHGQSFWRDCIENKVLAYLTTTQSAPVADTAPSVEEIEMLIDDWANVWPARFEKLAKDIHNLVVEREGGRS